MKKKNDKYSGPYKPSSIPPHLTPEEREKWIEELEWQEEEYERREKAGMYEQQKPRKKTTGWKTIKNMFKGVRLW